MSTGLLTIQLVRRAYLTEGTIGELSGPNFSLFTLEPPWKGNEREVSCIPVGDYELRWHESATKGLVLMLLLKRFAHYSRTWS